jgi:hypothetical protein
MIIVRKKTKKPIKPKKLNHEKKSIKSIRIFKKIASLVQFRFYKDETGKL